MNEDVFWAIFCGGLAHICMLLSIRREPWLWFAVCAVFNWSAAAYRVARLFA